MAAVLCSSACNLCQGCVEVAAWPCRKGRECCGYTCDALSDVICSPFAPYLATTIALNLAPVLYGLRSLRCGGDSSWLSLNALLAAGHVVGSFYIVNKIQAENNNEEAGVQTATAYALEEDGENRNKPARAHQTSSNSFTAGMNKLFAPPSTEQQHPSNIWNGLHAIDQPTATRKDEGAVLASVEGERDPAPAGSFQRTGRVLCHDVGVAVYILVAAFWFFWQMYGVSQVMQLDNGGNDEVGAECALRSWVVSSLLCGYLYMSLVVCVFGCSLFCLR